MQTVFWSSDLKQAVRSMVKNGKVPVLLNHSERKAVVNSMKSKNGQQPGRPRPEMWY